MHLHRPYQDQEDQEPPKNGKYQRYPLPPPSLPEIKTHHYRRRLGDRPSKPTHLYTVYNLTFYSADMLQFTCVQRRLGTTRMYQGIYTLVQNASTPTRWGAVTSPTWIREPYSRSGVSSPGIFCQLRPRDSAMLYNRGLANIPVSLLPLTDVRLETRKRIQPCHFHRSAFVSHVTVAPALEGGS